MSDDFSIGQYTCNAGEKNEVTLEPRRYLFEDANENGKLNARPNGETELFDLGEDRYVRANEAVFQCYKKLLKDMADNSTTKTFYAETFDSRPIEDFLYGPAIHDAINEFASQQKDHSVTMRHAWGVTDPHDADSYVFRIELMLRNGSSSYTITIEGKNYKELFENVMARLKQRSSMSSPPHKEAAQEAYCFYEEW